MSSHLGLTVRTPCLKLGTALSLKLPSCSESSATPRKSQAALERSNQRMRHTRDKTTHLDFQIQTLVRISCSKRARSAQQSEQSELVRSLVGRPGAPVEHEDDHQRCFDRPCSRWTDYLGVYERMRPLASLCVASAGTPARATMEDWLKCTTSTATTQTTTDHQRNPLRYLGSLTQVLLYLT